MIGLTARAFILPGMRKTRNPSRLAGIVGGAAEVAASVVLVSMTIVDASTPFWWFLWQTAVATNVARLSCEQGVNSRRTCTTGRA